MTTSLNLSKAPEQTRGQMAENIVRAKLNEFGFHCEDPKMRHTDSIAVKDGVRMPVQVKLLSLKRRNGEIHIDDSPLKMFKGLYIVLVEREFEDDVFLYVPYDDMQKLVEKYGHPRVKNPRIKGHKDRWWLYIPRDFAVFRKYATEDALWIFFRRLGEASNA